MVNVKIKNNDLKQLQQKLKKLKSISQQEFSNEIGLTAAKSSLRMKSTVPVDTGFLKQSIFYGAQKSKAILRAKAKYAPYVEFGTGRLVDLTDLKELGLPESYAARFKGKGLKQVNLPARPYFFSSIRYEFKKLLDRLDERFKKATR